MDWQKIKDMAKKGFETSKEFAEKTGVQSYEKLKESKFTLKDITSYEELTKEKRFAIFALRDGDIFTKFFLPFLPILVTKAWVESGSVRIIIEEWSDELRKTLEIDTIPSVMVKMNDGTIKKITDDTEIRAFIKNFSFYEKTEE
jgi:hypothetical protein